MKKRIERIFGLLFLAAVSFIIGTPTGYAGLYTKCVEHSDLRDQRTFSSNSYSPPLSEGGLSGYWPGGFAISWDISYDTNTALWSYGYILQASIKDISHFTVEVTEPSAGNDFLNVRINGEPSDFEGPYIWSQDEQGNSNPGMPADIYGIKFDYGGDSVTYSFDSVKEPVWGNFYSKDGKKEEDVFTHNNALGIPDFDSDNKLDFVARPDGSPPPTPVPENVSFAFFSSCMALAIVIYYSKKTKKPKKEKENNYSPGTNTGSTYKYALFDEMPGSDPLPNRRDKNKIFRVPEPSPPAYPLLTPTIRGRFCFLLLYLINAVLILRRTNAIKTRSSEFQDRPPCLPPTHTNDKGAVLFFITLSDQRWFDPPPNKRDKNKTFRIPEPSPLLTPYSHPR